MRKKIAVLADCTGNQLVGGILKGIDTVARKNDMDVFYFCAFPYPEESFEDNEGERNIYSLANMKDYDGVILLSFSFNSEEICTKLKQRIDEAGVIALTLDKNLDGIPGIETDNEAGTYELAKHLIEEHGVRRIAYISGQDSDENNQRFSGIKRALAEIGETVAKEDVILCNWSYYNAYKLTQEWLKDVDELPDAIMAASDLMGMGACAALEQAGYSIPKDIIVTGYDNVESSNTYMPAISTVDRELDTLGEAGMKKLIKLMNNEETPFRETIKSKARIAESCGCFQGNTYNILRNTLCKKQFLNQMMDSQFDRTTWALDRSMLGISTIDQLLEQLKAIATSFDIIAPEKKIYVLDSRYFSSVDSKIYATTNEGYSKSATAVYADKDTMEPMVKRIQTRDIIPFSLTDMNYSHSYVITALHELEHPYGYAVYVDSVDELAGENLITWNRTINRSLARAHENLKLEVANEKLFEASVRDTLSGLYNRQGYNEVAIPFLANNAKMQATSALLMVDIDRMKYINDKFGHVNGDVAIATVGAVIREVLPENWIGIRYGGDEFILIGVCDSEADMLDVEIRLQDSLKNYLAVEDIPFPLTMSIGGTLIPPTDDIDLERFISVADETMYQMKEYKHQQIQIWGELY